MRLNVLAIVTCLALGPIVSPQGFAKTLDKKKTKSKYSHLVVVNTSSSTRTPRYLGGPDDLNAADRFSLGGGIGLQGAGMVATYNLSREHFVDIGGSYDFSNFANLHAYSDYLLRYPELLSLYGFSMDWYYGGGAHVRTDNDPKQKSTYLVGPRLATGLNHNFESWHSLSAFGEMQVTQYVTQRTLTEIGIGFGARYYF